MWRSFHSRSFCCGFRLRAEMANSLRRPAKMKEFWDRIERWFSHHVGEHEFLLFPGATRAEIQEAGGILGLSLPDDVRDSYRAHDGMLEIPLYESHYLLPLKEITELWRSYCHLG